MKKSHLYHFKDAGFKTPEAYFDNFDERLFEKMAVQQEMASIKESGHKVPDHYFEDFDSKLLDRIKKDTSPKARRLLPWKNAAVVTAIAAALLLMFAIFIKSENPMSLNQIETVSIENYLTNEDLNIYDIASFLNEDDLDVDDFVYNTFSDEALENYLLNNASIEDLINLK